jgi:predicted permease
MLRRRPLVSAIALVSLVVGMSATTVVFSLLNAVAFRSLPVMRPAELRLVFEQRATGLNHNFSYEDFAGIRDNQRAFADVTAYSGVRAAMTEARASEMVNGEIVAGNFFSTIGVPVRLGRGLHPDDDRPGAAPAIVVSDRLWRRLHGDATVLAGATVVLNKQAFTVVGVAASPFMGMQLGRDAQFWAPLHQQPVLAPFGGLNLLTRPTSSWLTMLGRRRSGMSDAQTAAEINRVERALPVTPQRDRRRTFVVSPGHLGDSSLPQTAAAPLQLLLAAAGLVLVVACANVAGLLLARAAERERELVLRTALGASRSRVTRLLLAEAGLLGLGATAMAVIVAAVTTEAAVPLLSSFGQTVALDVSPDWRVLGFAAAVGLTATLGFGLVPALATFRRGIAQALGESGRSTSAGPGRILLRRGLVATQFALSLALVFVALLFVRTLYNLRTMATGFAIDRIAILGVDPQAAQLTPARTAEYFDAAAARLRAVPGVEAAAYAQIEPLDFGGSRMSVDVPGDVPRPDEDLELNYNRVSAEYFEAMGIVPIDGRVFDARDVAGAPRAVIVNETMARRFWPETRAVGREVRFSPTVAAAVVGVVPDVKYRMLREAAAPSFYLSTAQFRTPFASFHVRTVGAPAPLLDTLRRVLVDVDGAVPITRVRTLREQAAINVTDDRLAMTIAAALAAAASLLAAVGLYGAMTYAVGLRTREIGVRLALGARPPEVRRLVLRQGVAIAVCGSAAGIVLGLLFARAVEHRLFGIAAADAVTVAASLLVLTVIAVVATWTPARRASRVDPVEALRAE